MCSPNHSHLQHSLSRWSTTDNDEDDANLAFLCLHGPKVGASLSSFPQHPVQRGCRNRSWTMPFTTMSLLGPCSLHTQSPGRPTQQSALWPRLPQASPLSFIPLQLCSIFPRVPQTLGPIPRPAVSPSTSIYQLILHASWPAAYSPFRLNEHPSVSRARPPVGWHSTVEQLPHRTTVCE
jgi:hypothetical protein